MKSSIIAVLTLFVLYTSTIPTARACSPPDGPLYQPFKKEYKMASTVAKVRILSVERIEARQVLTYKTRVSKVFKGCLPNAGRIVYVSTGLYSSTCGARYTIGSVYVMMFGDSTVVDRKNPSVLTVGYFTSLFTFTPRFPDVSRKHKRFLWKASKRPANKCNA